MARLLRRPTLTTGPSLAGFAGLVVAVVGGLADLTTLWRSQPLFAGPDWLARACTAASVGAGLGLAVASWTVVRRLTAAGPRTPVAFAAPAGPPPATNETDARATAPAEAQTAASARATSSA